MLILGYTILWHELLVHDLQVLLIILNLRAFYEPFFAGDSFSMILFQEEKKGGNEKDLLFFDDSPMMNLLFDFPMCTLMENVIYEAKQED